MSVTVIGIDPGLGGAVAFLRDGGIDVWDTPVLTVAKGKSVRHEYNLAEMVALLRKIMPAYKHSLVAALERTHSMPGQGVRSMFTMGEGYGAWKGILTALGISFDLIAPERWKRVMMDGQGKDKDAARLRAIQLFPGLAGELARKKDHGRAEALLLAEYRRRLG